MARRVDWFKRLASAAERSDKWETKAEKVARKLERARNPETIKRLEREGRAAERNRAQAERDFREADKRLSPPPQRRGGGDVVRPVEYEYVARIDYESPRKGHSRVVELRLMKRDGSRATDDQVAAAVNGLARNRPLQGWKVLTLMYGKTEPNTRLAGSPDELQGLLMQFQALTVGEEERQ